MRKRRALIISESNIKSDGRLIELHNVFSSLFDISIISVGDVKNDISIGENTIIVKNNSILKRIIYPLKVLKYSRRTSFEILIVDNTFSCLSGLLIKAIIKPSYIVLDLRELYMKDDIKGIKSRVIHYFEKKMMKHSDIIMCANIYRSRLLKEEYNLLKIPLVFENIRHIDDEAEETIEYKDILINNKTIKLLSTAGLYRNRALPIVKEFMKLDGDYELYILGGGSKLEFIEVENFLVSNQIENVYLVGRVSRSILRYFIQKCDIGIVYYAGVNMNEKFCASGKIYEYINELKPVVAPDLLPISELCNSKFIGETNDILSEAIKLVVSNYNTYKQNVLQYKEELELFDFHFGLKQEIINSVKNKLG